MNFTDNEITITDIGRFKYSNKLSKQLYEYNAQMLFDVIRREYTDNPVIKEMIESDFDLTLYTCTKDGLRRVTVRCNRV